MLQKEILQVQLIKLSKNNDKKNYCSVKRIKLTKEKAEGFYSIHKDKSFFKDLIEYMINA